jgi:hypothetical protein
MPTRYRKNLHDDLHQAAETPPTPEELDRRREIVNRMREIRSRQTESGGPFPSIEEMLREDRDR